MASKKLLPDVEIQKPDDGRLDQCGIFICTPDGADMSAEEVLEAVAESLLRHWPNGKCKPRSFEQFDA